MLYRNKKTGAEFRTNCECKGKDWEIVDEKKKSAPKKPKGADK